MGNKFVILKKSDPLAYAQNFFTTHIRNEFCQDKDYIYRFAEPTFWNYPPFPSESKQCSGSQEYSRSKNEHVRSCYCVSDPDDFHHNPVNSKPCYRVSDTPACQCITIHRQSCQHASEQQICRHNQPYKREESNHNQSYKREDHFEPLKDHNHLTDIPSQSRVHTIRYSDDSSDRQDNKETYIPGGFKDYFSDDNWSYRNNKYASSDGRNAPESQSYRHYGSLDRRSTQQSHHSYGAKRRDSYNEDRNNFSTRSDSAIKYLENTKYTFHHLASDSGRWLHKSLEHIPEAARYLFDPINRYTEKNSHKNKQQFNEYASQNHKATPNSQSCQYGSLDRRTRKSQREPDKYGSLDRRISRSFNEPNYYDSSDFRASSRKQEQYVQHMQNSAYYESLDRKSSNDMDYSPNYGSLDRKRRPPDQYPSYYDSLDRQRPQSVPPSTQYGSLDRKISHGTQFFYDEENIKHSISSKSFSNYDTDFLRTPQDVSHYSSLDRKILRSVQRKRNSQKPSQNVNYEYDEQFRKFDHRFVKRSNWDIEDESHIHSYHGPIQFEHTNTFPRSAMKKSSSSSSYYPIERNKSPIPSIPEDCELDIRDYSTHSSGYGADVDECPSVRSNLMAPVRDSRDGILRSPEPGSATYDYDSDYSTSGAPSFTSSYPKIDMDMEYASTRSLPTIIGKSNTSTFIFR